MQPELRTLEVMIWPIIFVPEKSWTWGWAGAVSVSHESSGFLPAHSGRLSGCGSPLSDQLHSAVKNTAANTAVWKGACIFSHPKSLLKTCSHEIGEECDDETREGFAKTHSHTIMLNLGSSICGIWLKLINDTCLCLVDKYSDVGKPQKSLVFVHQQPHITFKTQAALTTLSHC